MKKLKLPIIREKIPPPKRLSMDDYARFVQLNLRYALDKKEYRRQKRFLAVNAPFFIKN